MKDHLIESQLGRLLLDLSLVASNLLKEIYEQLMAKGHIVQVYSVRFGINEGIVNL